MAKIAALFVAVAAIAGCSDSAERRASAELREQSDLGRRHFERAISLLSEPTSASLMGNEEALKALKDAQGVLNVALRGQADAMSKLPAQRLLADVETSIGNYYAVLSMMRQQRAMEHLARARQHSAVAEAYAGLSGFIAELARMSPAELEQMKQQAESAQSELMQKRQELESRTAVLANEVAELAATNDALLLRGRELMDQSHSARGEESLSLLKQANELNRQVSENSVLINERTWEQEANALDQAQVNSQLTSVQLRLEAVNERLAGLAARTEQSGRMGQSQEEKVAAVRQAMAAAAGEVAKEFKAADESFDLAQEAYQRAVSAASLAMSSADSLASSARSIRSENPQGSADDVLAFVAGPNGKAATLFQKGTALLSMAESKRLMLNTAEQIQAFVAENAASGVSESLTSAEAVGEMRRLAEEQYGEAAAAFESAAASVSSGPRTTGVDMRAVLWTYQGQQAWALLGQHYLTGQEEPLMQARGLVQRVLQENEGNPYVEPIRQIERVLAVQASM